MRGSKQHDTGIDLAIAELFGGIRHQVILFAAETGTRANWVATRLAALLSPPGEGVQHNVPAMQLEAPGAHRGVEPVEMAVDAYSGQAQPAVSAKRANSKIKEYWAAMTPAQRAAEMAKRLSKRANKTAAQKKTIKTMKMKAAAASGLSANNKTAIQKAKDAARHRALRAARKAEAAGVKIGRNGHPLLSPEEKRKKQKVYQARSTAKARGLPPPPLPGKGVTAVASVN